MISPRIYAARQAAVSYTYANYGASEHTTIKPAVQHSPFPAQPATFMHYPLQMRFHADLDVRAKRLARLASECNLSIAHYPFVTSKGIQHTQHLITKALLLLYRTTAITAHHLQYYEPNDNGMPLYETIETILLYPHEIISEFFDIFLIMLSRDEKFKADRDAESVTIEWRRR